MGGVSVTFTGMRERLQTLDRLEREQLPYAAMLALTGTAQDVKEGIVEEMHSALDRPTRWTLNSVFITPATKEKMEARVWIKDGDQGSKGTAAAEYLAPHIYSGPREHTGTEKMLYRRGVLGAGKYVVPGKDIRLDAHGNVGRGRLTKMLSGAGVFGEEGYDANATDSPRSKSKGIDASTLEINALSASGLAPAGGELVYRLPVDLVGAVVVMRFTRAGQEVLELTLGAGLEQTTPGTITRALTPEQTELLAGDWHYTLDVTFSDGAVVRYYQGGSSLGACCNGC